MEKLPAKTFNSCGQLEPAWVAAIKAAARARAQAQGIAQIQANLDEERLQFGRTQLQVVNPNPESLISIASDVVELGSHEDAPVNKTFAHEQHTSLSNGSATKSEDCRSPLDDGLVVHEHIPFNSIFPSPALRNPVAQTVIIRNVETLEVIRQGKETSPSIDGLPAPPSSTIGLDMKAPKMSEPKHNIEQSGGLILADGKPFKPSLETVERSVATKIFLENHYYGILKRPRDRDQRRKALERELAAASMTDSQQRAIKAAWTVSETEHLRDLRNRVHANSFKKLKTIGHGAFGVVSLVRERDSGELYAMKQLRKADMLRKGQEGHVRAERDIMSAASSNSLSRWIVRLVYSFQDTDHLYLVMEYMGGGDLLNLLIEKDIFEENFAKFYIAEMILAVQEAHKLGYIHRDIKVTL